MPGRGVDTPEEYERQMAPLARLLLLFTCGLAAYQIAIGIDGLAALPTFAYTLAFGILLVAGLLLIFLGFAVLESAAVVVISSLIPLSLSLGLVWEHAPMWRVGYAGFALLGLAAILLTRSLPIRSKVRVATVASVHGVAGMIIVLLPILLVVVDRKAPGFALVSVGGALIGLGGLLLSFLKAGRPLVQQQILLRMLPGLLLLMTVAFVAGFALG